MTIIRSKRSFTLLELVVVVVLVGVLAAVGLTRFFKVLHRARAIEGIEGLRRIHYAVQRCATENGHNLMEPTTLDGNRFRSDCLPFFPLFSAIPTLGIDDPGASPNAKFSYQLTYVKTDGVNVCYSFTATSTYGKIRSQYCGITSWGSACVSGICLDLNEGLYMGGTDDYAGMF